VDRILAGLHIGPVDGLLLDLGVSSHQLDRAERGFSFSSDAPLDMRMDRRRKVCAADLVKSLPEAKAVRIAGAIAARRKVAPIETTSELASLIAKTVGASGRRGKIHPATRTFQALRIAVNEELENLHGTIVRSVPCLKKGGRFSIISFHSLEDRIVKNTFRSLEKGCICPADLPLCRCGREPQLKVLTKRPVTPGPGEIEENPRSRSAKLRTAERI